jgi:hypothetical protein
MDVDAPAELRDELSWLEGTLLNAMRTWVLARKKQVSSETPIRIVFDHLRAVEGANHLDRMMQTLSTGCTRMIYVHCTCDPVLSDDEVTLLDVLAVLQQRAHDDALDLLRTFLDPTASHAAAGEALAIVQLLNGAGHTIVREGAALRRHRNGNGCSLAGFAVPRKLH